MCTKLLDRPGLQLDGSIFLFVLYLCLCLCCVLVWGVCCVWSSWGCPRHAETVFAPCAKRFWRASQSLIEWIDPSF